MAEDDLRVYSLIGLEALQKRRLAMHQVAVINIFFFFVRVYMQVCVGARTLGRGKEKKKIN